VLNSSYYVRSKQIGRYGLNLRHRSLFCFSKDLSAFVFEEWKRHNWNTDEELTRSCKRTPRKNQRGRPKPDSGHCSLKTMERTQACEHLDSTDPGISPAYSQWEAWKAVVEQREHQIHDPTHQTSGFATCQISHLEQSLICWSDCNRSKNESDMRSSNCVPHAKYMGSKLESQNG
jgi:hypothetical protein